MFTHLHFHLFYPHKSYTVEKVHCVWLLDGEMKVLFETKALPSPDNLRAVPFQFVSNKELVTEYLAKTEYIPHIRTVITCNGTYSYTADKPWKKIISLIVYCTLPLTFIFQLYITSITLEKARTGELYILAWNLQTMLNR